MGNCPADTEMFLKCFFYVGEMGCRYSKYVEMQPHGTTYKTLPTDVALTYQGHRKNVFATS